MKKIALLLAIVLFAAPAGAVTVDVNSSCESNVVTITMTNAGPNNVRAIALNITVDNSQTITAVDAVNTEYWVIPVRLISTTSQVWSIATVQS